MADVNDTTNDANPSRAASWQRSINFYSAPPNSFALVLVRTAVHSKSTHISRMLHTYICVHIWRWRARMRARAVVFSRGSFARLNSAVYIYIFRNFNMFGIIGFFRVLSEYRFIINISWIPNYYPHTDIRFISE